jgi:hypothetical protein
MQGIVDQIRPFHEFGEIKQEIGLGFRGQRIVG